jgi:hypothetical protein
MMALPLLPGESVLWQAQPHWRAVACSVFHLRAAALYFAVLVIVDAATDRWHGLSPAETLVNALPLVGTAIVACALLLLLGWVTARTTAYTLTNRRVVLRYGMALPVTLALPLRVIGAVAVRVDHDHTGDIPLTLRPGERVGFLKLWPLVRPWRFAPAQPMLRAVPQAGMVAAVLSRTLAAAEHDARASVARPDAGGDMPSMPEQVEQVAPRALPEFPTRVRGKQLRRGNA